MSRPRPPARKQPTKRWEDVRFAHLEAVLSDRYRFEGLLAKGGSSTVFRVVNLRLNRVEALKLLAEGADWQPEFGQRFSNEAQVAASLSHPNILKIHDFGENEGFFWYSMEYVDGPTLAHLVKELGPLDEATTVALALQILNALDYSHKRGVIHRDIKPSNIMLDSDGRPYLMDFGVAKTTQSLLKTQTGIVLGTPAYVAPEQASGAELDGRVDIYALGVTLYETLTGSYPFAGTSALEAVVKRLTEDPEPLGQKRPGLNPGLEGAVMKALERDRDRRYPTAAAMRQDLLAALPEDAAGQDLAALVASSTPREPPQSRTPTDGATIRLPKETRLGPALRWTIAIAGLTAVVGGGAWLLRNALEDPSAPPQRAELARPSADVPDGSPAGGREAIPTAATPSPALPTSAPPTPTADTATSQPPPPAQAVAASAAPAAVPRRPVTPPFQLEAGTAELPGELLARCAGEIVNLSVVVGVDGRVRSSRVLAAATPECGDAAQATAAQYVFRPALDAQGEPIEATVAVAVELQPEPGGSPEGGSDA